MDFALATFDPEAVSSKGWSPSRGAGYRRSDPRTPLTAVPTSDETLEMLPTQSKRFAIVPFEERFAFVPFENSSSGCLFSGHH